MYYLYFLFYLISIFAITIHAAALMPATNVYDIVTMNFTKSCPVLSNSSLVDRSTKYFSFCKDVSLNNLPDKISMVDLNKFYCIGLLVADSQLCNTLQNNSYPFLPKSNTELDSYVKEIQKNKPEILCTKLNSFDLFNETNISSSLTKPLLEFKKKLTGQTCPKLCSDLDEETSNEVCSIIYLIYTHISNISRIQQKSVMPGKNINIPPMNSPVLDQNKKISQQETVVKTIENSQLPPVEHLETHKEISDTGSRVIAPQNPAKISSIAQAPNQDVPKQATSKNHMEQTPNNLAVNAEEVIPTKLPAVVKTDQLSPPTDKPTVKTQNEPVPEPQGEIEHKTIEVTNEKTNNVKINKNENEPLADGKETSTISNDLNYMKQSSFDDYPDETEDDDENESLKINDETNPAAQNTQNQFEKNRSDFTHEMKEPIEEEESNFFSYFMFISVVFIAGYVVYHNKQKILGLIVEGRRDRNSRRRPSTSSYRKLNSNLEEAVTSKCSGSASHVIY